MGYYVTICGCIALLYGSWKVAPKKINKKYLLIVILFVLWFLATFRATSVGADTLNYTELFEQIKGFTFREVFTADIYDGGYTHKVDFEVGFKLLIYLWVNIFFFLPARSALGLVSFLTLFFVYKAIRYQSPMPIMSIWLYITLAFYQTSLNMQQNALAIAIALWAIKFINEKKSIYWMLALLFATLIHMSSLFLMPLYWLSKIKFDGKKFVLTIGVIGGVLAFSEGAIRAISRFIPIQYLGYLNTEKNATDELLVLVLHCILIASIYFVTNAFIKRNKNTIRFNIYINPYFMCFIAEIALYMLSLTALGLARAATLFSPTLILYIPILIGSIQIKATRKRAMYSIILLSFIAYVIRLAINNIGSTQPYSFV